MNTVKVWYILSEDLKKRLRNKARKMCGWNYYSETHRSLVEQALEAYMATMEDFKDCIYTRGPSKRGKYCGFFLNVEVVNKWDEACHSAKVPPLMSDKVVEEAITLYLDACEDLEGGSVIFLNK